NRPLDRVAPALFGLVRKSGNKVDVDVFDSRRAQAPNLSLAGVACVQPAHRCSFAIYKRLHAQTDAIGSVSQQLFESFVGKLTWSAFEGYLRVFRNLEFAAQRAKYLLNLGR